MSARIHIHARAEEITFKMTDIVRQEAPRAVRPELFLRQNRGHFKIIVAKGLENCPLHVIDNDFSTKHQRRKTGQENIISCPAKKTLPEALRNSHLASKEMSCAF